MKLDEVHEHGLEVTGKFLGGFHGSNGTRSGFTTPDIHNTQDTLSSA